MAEEGRKVAFLGGVVGRWQGGNERGIRGPGAFRHGRVGWETRPHSLLSERYLAYQPARWHRMHIGPPTWLARRRCHTDSPTYLIDAFRLTGRRLRRYPLARVPRVAAALFIRGPPTPLEPLWWSFGHCCLTRACTRPTVQGWVATRLLGPLWSRRRRIMVEGAKGATSHPLRHPQTTPTDFDAVVGTPRP